VVIRAGAVAFWRDLFPGQHKFVYILGIFHDEDACEFVAYFTISSQQKWMAIPELRRETVDIPKGTADYLPAPLFIQCWKELGVQSLKSFRELEGRGIIMYRGDLFAVHRKSPGSHSIVRNPNGTGD
jgi:hypothetical protein